MMPNNGMSWTAVGVLVAATIEVWRGVWSNDKERWPKHLAQAEVLLLVVIVLLLANR